MIGRCLSAPRASPGAPVGARLLGVGVALGCGAAVGAGWLLGAVGAGMTTGCGVGAMVAAAGAAVGATAMGARALGWPPQAANASVPPSSSASRRNSFGESIEAPLWIYATGRLAGVLYHKTSVQGAYSSRVLRAPAGRQPRICSRTAS